MNPNADQFTPYGPSHLTALLVLLVGALAVVAAGRHWRERDPDDRLGKLLAVAILATTVLPQAVYFTPGQWNPYATLPLQLCDWASLVSVYALWTHRWWAVALTYYWGLFLTTQAIATPDLRPDFPDLDFLLFWSMHVATVWAAVYLTFGRGVVPDWRSYRFVMALTAAWAVSVFCLNVVLDSNYGYLNGRPKAPTVLDVLGPWPWYVLAEIAILAGGWALATWPWVSRARRNRIGAAGRTSQARAGGG